MTGFPFACIVLWLVPAASQAAMGMMDIDRNVSILREELDELRRENAVQRAELVRLQAASKLQTSGAKQPTTGASSAAALSSDRIVQLEGAIRRGEEASGNLRKHIANLEAETKRLNEEKQQLVNIQTALTSGLIGALVTTVVAVAGALTNFRRSRADRDYRRLEVIEKSHALASEGHSIPTDIAAEYFAGKQPSEIGKSANHPKSLGETA